jgi:(E)-4-hydroxy-3-methyl-but-2-enyl pyrophosphate reductase
MKIVIAKSSGFCLGVRRAVEMVLDASSQNERSIYTYGPLIHNPQVLLSLEERGVHAFKEVPSQGSGSVLIRAHGVTPDTRGKLEEAGFDVLNATCPRVVKIQSIIKKYAGQNYAVIILGDKNHPEVVGLLGYAGKKAFVVNAINELDSLPAFEKAIIVAQSTQNIDFFARVKDWAHKNFPDYIIFDTICDSTEKRQMEVRKLTEYVDILIVVGGKESGNTQRLVEIGKKSGKPTFHIETESDLDSINAGLLCSASAIGITAGASTPNWIIKRVYKALEELPYKNRRGWRATLFRFQRALLLTNIYVSLGAGFLTYACINLLGLNPYWPYLMLSMLYVQSMHIINHLIGTVADRYNDPQRASFYEKNRNLLLILAVVTGSAGLVLAYHIEFWSFAVLFVMSVAGLSYNLTIFPKNFPWFRYRRFRDFPGSKPLLIAVAWGVLAAILPPLFLAGKITWINLVVFFWAAGLVFVRTGFFDILDMQGDRLVGKETIALLLGEKKSIHLLTIILLILIAMLPTAAALKLISPIGYLLTLCPVFLLIILSAYKNRMIMPSTKLEFLVESHFILAGLITIIDST